MTFSDNVVEFCERWYIIYSYCAFPLNYFNCLVYSKGKFTSKRWSPPKRRSQIITYYTKIVLMLVFEF